jgi:putative toxin-antitoxin system antitoxin component (TIGR02293 family)
MRIRGLARQLSDTLGNLWLDLTRALPWILLPGALIDALLLVWQGVPMNLRHYAAATTVEDAQQKLHSPVYASFNGPLRHPCRFLADTDSCELMRTPFVAMIYDIMVNELRAVVEELGGEQTLGRALSSDRDMREAIREGFPPAVVKELMRASGLTLTELASSLDLSARSLQRRSRSGRLTRYESDRLYRLARIVAIANEYLGDHERALRWLKHPNRALGGLAPVAAIDTELGARQVENILGRIAYGGIS